MLLYHLEQGSTEDIIIRQCQQTGRPLPSKIANAPELLPGLSLFLRAFYALSTCRYVGMAEGPIPWVAIDRYCEANEIHGDLREEVFHHVRKMDGVYLKHQSKTTKEKTSVGKKGKFQATPGLGRDQGPRR